MIGKTFGRWTVISSAPAIRYPCGTVRDAWLCRCACGTESAVVERTLTRGESQSCGCLRGEQLAARQTAHGHAARATPSKEHIAWKNMKARCYNEKSTSYPNYGGRGIRVCKRWIASFEAFLADMGRCPDGHSLDRIDANGHYEPGNCRWATKNQQARNARSVPLYSFEGQTLSCADWAERTGIPANVIRERIKRYGWPVSRALTTPLP